ncbi:MAG: hypothetical protein PHE24_05325 [Patescibacteria group bacterium]|nr:hypothetical protein [Patescibacteria group bacterium]
MPDQIIIPGIINVLRPVLQICGEVHEVFTQETGMPEDPSFPLLFPQNFSLLKIVEPENKKKRCRDLVTVVLVDNRDIPETSITGENSVIGQDIFIESSRLIVFEKSENRVPGKPGHRLFKGTFLALRQFTEILGLVTKVITKQNRLPSDPTSKLFDEGFYFIRIVEERADKRQKVRQETSVIVDGNSIPPSSIAGKKNSIVGKIVVLEPNQITVTNLTGED